MATDGIMQRGQRTFQFAASTIDDNFSLPYTFLFIGMLTAKIAVFEYQLYLNNSISMVWD